MNPIIEKALSVLLESSKKFDANNSTPDKAYFDGRFFRLHASAGPFGFIGPKEVLVYSSIVYENHNELFSDVTHKIKRSSLKTFGPLSDADIDYAKKVQDLDNDDNDDARILTKSGRIWTEDISHNVIVFWCREKDVTKENLESLKKNLKLKEFYWSATDSRFYNHYGTGNEKPTDQASSTSNTKEYHSKRHPEYTHDMIVKLLAKLHTGDKALSPIEHEILVDIGKEKNPSKIYPKGYHAGSRTSESFEN